MPESTPLAPVIHLASASPRRCDILVSLGIPFSAAGVDIDEAQRQEESPQAMVMRLACEKARAAAAAMSEALPVLGADTIVVLDGEVFGKPASKEQSLRMLQALSGRSHQVLTAVALHADRSVATAQSTTTVTFRDIDPDEARLYWQSGEPAGKAGSYAIQGVGGAFVSHLDGSYSGVVGLPVYETTQLLAGIGINVLQMAGDRDGSR